MRSHEYLSKGQFLFHRHLKEVEESFFSPRSVCVNAILQFEHSSPLVMMLLRRRGWKRCCVMVGSCFINTLLIELFFFLFPFVNIFPRNEPCVIVFQIVALSSFRLFSTHTTGNHPTSSLFQLDFHPPFMTQPSKDQPLFPRPPNQSSPLHSTPCHRTTKHRIPLPPTWRL